MTKAELTEILDFLGLSQVEAAQLLGIAPRTMRRWLEGEEVPGPAEAALKAWRNLKSHDLAWRPDSLTIVDDDREQIALHRNHTIGLSDLLKRVEARGGARTPWKVDIAARKAKLGPIEVGFYVLQSGSFSLSTYTRRDREPDLNGDWPLIEDAASSIAAKLAAWKCYSDSLFAVARRLKSMPAIFAHSGPKLLSPQEKAQRKSRMLAIADRISELAQQAISGEGKYEAFESLNREIHQLGTKVDDQLISDVARARYEVSR